MKKYISKEKLKNYNFYLMIFFILGFFSKIIKEINPDPDMWFLAATGRYIVENKTVPTINPFIIHEEFEIVIQQWIIDIINYEIYNNFGMTGIYIYALTVFAIALFVFNKYLKKYISNNKKRLMLIMLAGLYLVQFSTSRPNIVSFIVFTLLLIVLEKYIDYNDKKILLVLPILSLVEINLQSSMWPMMFVIMIPYIFPKKISKKNELKSNIKKWLNINGPIIFIMIVMFITGFLNPNGINGMLYLIKSYKAASKCGIMEMSSPTYFSFNGTLLFIAIVIYVFYLTKAIIKKENINFPKFYMASGTILLSMMCLRNTWYLVFGVIPLLAIIINEYEKENDLKLSNNENVDKNEKKLYLLLLLKCVLKTIIIIPVVILLISSTQYNHYNSDITPLEAVEYIKKFDHKEVKIFNDFNAGAYLEWCGYKTYIDTRPELFDIKINNKEDILTEILMLNSAQIDFNEFLLKYNFTHLICLDGYAFTTYMENNNEYTVVVDSDGYKLFEKINFSE